MRISVVKECATFIRTSAIACGIATVLLAAAGQVLAASPAGTDWGANAKSFRGQNGAQLTFLCPAGGSFGSIWGTDVYTDDSSVCTAAVHAGKITQAGGGTVAIEIRAGLSSYTGSARNGVTTTSYGGWGGSFVVVGATGGGGATGVRAGFSGWGATATSFRGQNGARYRYSCPAGGQAGNIWGTAVYTDDTSVCTAAVHAGRITFARGGSVTVEIRAGRSSYTGTARHGITSRSYGPWNGSFVFTAA